MNTDDEHTEFVYTENHFYVCVSKRFEFCLYHKYSSNPAVVLVFKQGLYICQSSMNPPSLGLSLSLGFV